MGGSVHGACRLGETISNQGFNGSTEFVMTFRAPVRELAFALSAVGHDELVDKYFPDLDSETVEAVLEAAGAFAADVLAPLNRPGDLEGARLENGVPRAPAGFVGAYRQFIEQGWASVAAEPETGGQGLGKPLETAVYEMIQAANMAFGLCPMLSMGAIEALQLQGNERQKRLVLPKLVSGEWTGAMCMTEPQAGTDLSALTTRAEPAGDGTYRLHGEKIFISWGDHDLAENVVHLVLARTPDAPAGNKGVSLFLTSRQRLGENGELGARNDFRAASLEHKLGIHASPTCVMLYEGAEAELVGELHNGIAHMFVMMNAARLAVGVQGVAIAERAFQQALSYAQERRQGRALWAAEGAIIGHPDVRRMLALSKARIAAARSLCLYTAVMADIAHRADGADDRAQAQARLELLTPIAKAWSTDVGVEVASTSLQVHGGMGFIEETGAAQHYRDARIAPIYEGTNGIQALDLIGRKLAQDGAAMRALITDMRLDAERLSKTGELAEVGGRLDAAIAALEAATDWVVAHRGADALAAATPYLKLAGDVIGGWMLGRHALLAADRAAGDPWLAGKAPLARLYASQVLTLAPGAKEAICAGADDLAAADVAVLAAE
jgi:alkylation response protein AidB-like acyl-CoA dehydrogenase